MDNESYQIVSVYHKHVECNPTVDRWSRRNVHGLNVRYLQMYGLQNQCELVLDFKNWLNSFHVLQIYANDPHKERILLQNNRINDILLPAWTERVAQPYHCVAARFKELNVPILDKKCDGYVHNSFVGDHFNKMNKSQVIKLLHGYHCSLYDVYELYLFYVFQTQYL